MSNEFKTQTLKALTKFNKAADAYFKYLDKLEKTESEKIIESELFLNMAEAWEDYNLLSTTRHSLI